jgi:hypothetical protein
VVRFTTSADKPLTARATYHERYGAALAAAGLEVPEGADQHVFTLHGVQVDVVKQFTYLGRVFSVNDSDEAAVKARLRIADATFASLRNRLFRRSSIGVDTKLAVWRAIVGAQVLYGSESLCPDYYARQRLDSFQQRHLRNITGIRARWNAERGRLDQPRADEVLRRAGMPTLSAMVDGTRLRFHGHALRRPISNDVRLLSSAQIDGLNYTHLPESKTLRGQVKGLMVKADLTIDDAITRARWRKGVRTFLEGNRQGHALGVGAEPQGEAPAGQAL